MEHHRFFLGGGVVIEGANFNVSEGYRPLAIP